MALSTGNPHLRDVQESGTIGGVSFVDVDYATNGTGATASPDAFVAVADGEMIRVLCTQIITAGTTNGDLDIGIVTAAGAAGDVDGFCDGIDMDDAAGTMEVAAGAYTDAKGGWYTNISGATQYLAGTNLTAANAAGKIRIFYEKKALPLNA